MPTVVLVVFFLFLTGMRGVVRSIDGGLRTLWGLSARRERGGCSFPVRKQFDPGRKSGFFRFRASGRSVLGREVGARVVAPGLRGLVLSFAFILVGIWVASTALLFPSRYGARRNYQISVGYD